jgi:hypothetical protein
MQCCGTFDTNIILKLFCSLFMSESPGNDLTLYDISVFAIQRDRDKFIALGSICEMECMRSHEMRSAQKVSKGQMIVAGGVRVEFFTSSKSQNPLQDRPSVR